MPALTGSLLYLQSVFPSVWDHAVERFPLHGNTPSRREQQAPKTGLYKQTIKTSWSQCLYIYLKMAWRWRKRAFRCFLRQENIMSRTCSLRMQKLPRRLSGLDNSWGGKTLLPTGVSASHARSSRAGFSVTLVPLSPLCSSSTLWLHSSKTCQRSHRLITLDLNEILSLISIWYLWWVERDLCLSFQERPHHCCIARFQDSRWNPTDLANRSDTHTDLSLGGFSLVLRALLLPINPHKSTAHQPKSTYSSRAITPSC